MYKHPPMKSTLVLALITASLILTAQVNAGDSNLSIHVDPETSELLQTSPTSNNKAKRKDTTQTTRQLLSIEASPVAGGGFIITPNKAFLPQMSVRLDKNGHMQTICQ